MGADASKSLADLDFPIGKMRGKVLYHVDEIMLVPTYHPSYLLRDGGIKSDSYPKVIEDFELVKKCVEEVR